MKRSVRGLVVVGVLAVAAGAVVAPGGAVAASPGGARQHVAAVGTHYSVLKPLCAAPKPGHASCMAIRRVTATRQTPGAQPAITRSAFPVGPSGYGLTPDDFATAYGYDADTDASDQIVAIVDAYNAPTILSDLNVFDTQYGLPLETADNFKVLGQTGSPTALPVDDTTGWAGEEALDVQTVRGVCHTCQIVLVEANSASNKDLEAGVKTAIALGATEISNSYGGPEYKKSAAAEAAKVYTHKGVVITASTGDDGWYSFDIANDNKFTPDTANIPSTLPTVVSVGGTKLNLRDDATRASETVWNENGPADSIAFAAGASQGASGGGCSVYYAAKGWQRHVANYAKTGCGKARLAADVSADADPNTGYDVYLTYGCGADCGWTPIGGTSLSSPLVAGMWALAGGAGEVKYPVTSLYGHFASKHNPFYDVTHGSNSWCGGDSTCSADTDAEIPGPGPKNPNALFFGGTDAVGVLDCGFATRTNKPTVIKADHQCNAAKGYDGPSGVGTPNGLKGFAAMVPSPKITHGALHAKRKTTFTAKGRDPFPGGTFVKYRWTFGSRKASGKSPSIGFAKPGRVPVTLTVTDNYGQSATASIKVTVKPAHKGKKK